MTDEQIKDIFEKEVEKASKMGECIIRFETDGNDIFDGNYSTAETAMLETVRQVLTDFAESIISKQMKKEVTDRLNCPNCGVPFFLSPLGDNGVHCTLCQPE